MRKNRDNKLPETPIDPSRRKFLAVGGLGAAGLIACAGADGKPGAAGAEGATGATGATGTAGATGATGSSAPNGLNTLPTSWDYAADVVVIGSGAAGMVAALAAREKGASVIVVEAGYDVGGHAIVSGGMVDLGGGTGWQVAAGITNDTPDKVFQDLVFPAGPASAANPAVAYQKAGTPGYFPGLKWASYSGPYQDRGFTRVFADNNVAAEKFLRDHGIQWWATVDTHHWSNASNIGRTHTPLWKGNTSNPTGVDSPAGNGGVGYIRPLEKTARNMGIQFLLNYRVNTIHREAVLSGGVKGVTAAYTPMTLPGQTTPIAPYCTTQMAVADGFPNTGNIAENHPSVTIRANKGVFVATGGASSNVALREIFDARLCDCFQVAGEPYSQQTGDGIALSQKCGAALFAMGNMTSGEDQGTGGSQITKPGSIGCKYGYQNLKWQPASPVFPLAGATGIPATAQNGALGYLIHVNMAGQRFADETAAGYTWIDAALQPNKASIGPDWSAGPVWAIFDSKAVTAMGSAWNLTGTNVDPSFFYSANTVADLVKAINTNQYQSGPMLAADLQATLDRYNGFVTAAADADFGKPAASLKSTIDTAPFYAAFSAPVVHDWLTGIRIDEGAHVLDLDGKPIPGLYAAGEDVGGMVMHGLAKCAVFGMIGGYNAGLGV